MSTGFVNKSLLMFLHVIKSLHSKKGFFKRPRYMRDSTAKSVGRYDIDVKEQQRALANAVTAPDIEIATAPMIFTPLNLISEEEIKNKTQDTLRSLITFVDEARNAVAMLMYEIEIKKTSVNYLNYVNPENIFNKMDRLFKELKGYSERNRRPLKTHQGKRQDITGLISEDCRKLLIKSLARSEQYSMLTRRNSEDLSGLYDNLIKKIEHIREEVFYIQFLGSQEIEGLCGNVFSALNKIDRVLLEGDSDTKRHIQIYEFAAFLTEKGNMRIDIDMQNVSPSVFIFDNPNVIFETVRKADEEIEEEKLSIKIGRVHNEEVDAISLQFFSGSDLKKTMWIPVSQPQSQPK